MMLNARECKTEHHQSFWAQHGPPGAETLAKAKIDFTSFWAQQGPPGAETLVNA